MIFISAYRAINNPDICKDYIKEHVQVLKDFGIESITSNNEKWIFNPNMYCFIATNSHNELIGGIRIQIADGNYQLPVEEAVGFMDSKIYSLIREYAINGGVGELCGLWNSNKIRGLGLGVILVRAAISTINQLKFQTLSGICAGYSLQMFQNVGFVINKGLGENGNFVYPNENYLAHVVGILNGITLNTAKEYDKDRILTLRQNPIQIREERGPKGDFTVNYNLMIKNVIEVKLPKLYLNIK